ncbi:MBL fold metallo-hydrolase [Paenibacillus macerans]|uniref:MBL fold metallo-hydrolase n=1 Tax=Paenibacillus macerans TaxID=44252 RepID=UPI00203B70A0|nr:MBL fold metallo-hydrolase [Paenibacillus macerans]MCM3701845.1 MBL fold metallo-hydrolase [Paenibacillus macerans]
MMKSIQTSVPARAAGALTSILPDAPKAQTSLPIKVKVQLYLGAAGYCTHPEFLTLRGGRLRPVRFPAGFACIVHPRHGPVMVDTGYSSRFFAETAKLPNALYRYITPVVYEERDSAASWLRERLGMDPEQVKYVILTHFHADHIAGVKDFPQAKLIYLLKAYEAVRSLRPLAAVRAGFLPGLLPDPEQFAARSEPIDDGAQRFRFGPEFPFAEGFDVFGDGSVIAVEVSGHAEGMIGLFASTEEADYFLCADTVWSSRAFREGRRPHPAAGIIMSDRREYGRSFDRLMELHRKYPDIRIVPSHCTEALRLWGTEARER